MQDKRNVFDEHSVCQSEVRQKQVDQLISLWLFELNPVATQLQDLGVDGGSSLVDALAF